MRTIRKIMALVAVFVIAATVTIAAPAASNNQGLSGQQIAQKVRHELVTLPYYGVFDNLSYKVEGSTVTLYGQVVQPTTRKDAERRVAAINGVERVINNIEVLPLSPFDDSIRVHTYRAIFNTGSLYRYAMGANPSIHIVVRNGNVTLEGVVANEADSQLAYMAARNVPGVFSVTNNLRSERG
ncbi:MAG TPA: BON domain-containing protein, partial [Pyrinomonadaceae bacterium]|nr:BON domain-containing protein [Pyrinomonadaceae bacterium]